MNPLYNNEVITTTPFIVDNTIQATRFNKGKSLVSFIYEQKKFTHTCEHLCVCKTPHQRVERSTRGRFIIVKCSFPILTIER